MGRKYRAVAANTAQTTAIDLLEINVASTKCVKLLEVHISQATEIGDAQEEHLLVTIKEGATSSGSGGSSPTAVPASKGDSAYAGTVEANNTTQASGGTIVTHVSQNWNIRVPLDIIFTPETVIELPPSARLVISISAPADSTTLGGYAVFEEIG
jgi:hypothetical protein